MPYPKNPRTRVPELSDDEWLGRDEQIHRDEHVPVLAAPLEDVLIARCRAELGNPCHELDRIDPRQCLSHAGELRVEEEPRSDQAASSSDSS